MGPYERLQTCVQSVRAITDFVPEVALVLGSGLGDYGDQVDLVTAVEYGQIKNFPVSTAPGHRGRFLFGYVAGVPVVVMQGRIHYYEGYSMQDVVLPTRLMGMLGAKALLLTNASGGVNFTYSPGDFMLIRDQIASFVPSPLVGPNVEELGTRFPDMSCIYDDEFCRAIRGTAAQTGIPLHEGNYIQLTGPQFESPAEIRMCRALGADAVGMSTACEAIAAHHMGMRVAGIACITNMACGMTSRPVTGAEVDETAARVAGNFTRLVNASVQVIHKLL